MRLAVMLAAGLFPAVAMAQSVVIGNGAREEVQVGASVRVEPQGIEVQSGGSLAYLGSGTTAALQAGFSGPTAGVPITVKSGASVELKCSKFENLTTLTIEAGGTLLRVRDVVFQDLAGLNPANWPWLDVSAMTASDRDRLPFSLNRVTFTWVAGTRVNVKAGATTPLLRMLGNPTAGGNRWGATYENDASSRVSWHTGAVTRSVSGSGSFDTLEDALKDAGTTATSVLTVTLGANAFIDDVLDWNTNAGASSAGPTVKKACLAPLVGPAIMDGDGGSAVRGKLVNCVVARSSVEETTAENCTFFWPGTSTISISNVIGTNVLVESGNPGTGNVLTTSVTTTLPAFFVDAAAFNFHLATPGGAAAIDAGTSLSEAADFEGELRGFDGNSSGGGQTDIGADELIFPSVTTVTHRTVDTTPLIQGIAVSGTVGYTVGVFRNGLLIGTIVVPAGNALSFQDTIQPEGSYTYTFAYQYGGAYTGSGVGAVVTVDLTPPAMPTDVAAIPRNGAVDVEWAASTSSDVLGYQVYRSTDGVNFTLRSPAGQLVTGTKYRDTPVTNGTLYYYRVVACDGALPQ
jgi:hypothetical protein